MWFSAAAWRRRYRRQVRGAFRTVGFYRDQWAAAGRVLADPVPTPVADLPDPPFLLCPVSSPYLPTSEPSLWTPDPAALAGALRLAGVDGAVLEVRDALVDQESLAGARYGVLLGPRARTASAEHRTVLNREAAAGIESALVVGTADELDAVLPELPPTVTPIRRGSPGACLADPASVLVHDRRLGYLGARMPSCGELHLDWRRVYAEVVDGLLAISLPSQRRPVVARLVPEDADGALVEFCPTHRTPILRAAPNHP